MAEALRAGGKGQTKCRRRFTEEFKREVVAETLSGEHSVAGVALRHGLNNNLVFTWRRKQLRALSGVTAMPAKLLPVTMTVPSPALPVPLLRTGVKRKRSARARSSGTIEIECNGMRIVVRGAVDAQALQMVLGALGHS
jgi:transposase